MTLELTLLARIFLDQHGLSVLNLLEDNEKTNLATATLFLLSNIQSKPFAKKKSIVSKLPLFQWINDDFGEQDWETLKLDLFLPTLSDELKKRVAQAKKACYSRDQCDPEVNNSSQFDGH